MIRGDFLKYLCLELLCHGLSGIFKRRSRCFSNVGQLNIAAEFEEVPCCGSKYIVLYR
jgi:hypothetical protein